ncbi:YifB family Mg chelatase-like AAA ATPase [Romboutsia sp.]|uniref:YifB family Mg chelatase-like AAA ATPase n=1 Tax=Romboutsia sp. TaxID=1965302 RepID=UPI003F37917E
MLSIINSSNLMGIEAVLTKVEVDITNGIPCLNIVGLPSAEIRESRERVKSAIINSGYKFPNSRIIVNLSPADIKKEGSFFDLSIAIGIIRINIKKDNQYIKDSMFVGELSLDGKLRKVRGILPIIICAKSMGLKRVFIPLDNIVEASFIEGIDIVPLISLKQCIEFLNHDLIINQEEIIKDRKNQNYHLNEKYYEEDFCEVAGNEFVKRSAEIAAAGNHNIFMIGPPGAGKTMIAKRLRTILPDIQKEEMIEISKIYSAAGLIDENKGIINHRPFRAPHHTTTKQSLIGGGHDARPGEVVLAHKGVLFLDEIAEFDRKILETLRQPIEDKNINISRVKYNFVYPCNVLLIAAMNPCPCGYSMSETECRCRQYEIDRYINRISGPLLDRFDIFVEVSSLPYKDFIRTNSEKSKTIKNRVEIARKIQIERFKEDNIKTNDEMKLHHIKKYCKLEEDVSPTLNLIYDKYKLSNRAYVKLIKVARTIADLEIEENIKSNHIIEAFSFRKAYYNYFK